jgi:type I restriction enzyme S subunit
MSEYLNLSHYPKDWTVNEGHSFLTLGSGVSPSGILFSPNGDTPYMKVDDFNNPENGTFIKVTKLRFDKEANRIPLAHNHSIIIAKRGAAIFKNRVRISQQTIAVDTNLMTILVSENHCYVYFKYLLKFINLGSIADTTSIPQLNNFHLNEASFAFPPLPEQQKIAAILTSVDEVIEKTQAQIDKLKDLKTAMMQTLLTNGVGTKQASADAALNNRKGYIPHTEFKDSPVGRIPKGWEVSSLKDIICSMNGGVSVNGENRPISMGEIGVLKVSSVFKGKFLPKEHKAVIKEDKSRVRVNPLKDRILFSRANTPALVGESGYVERTYTELYLPDKIWMIDVKDRTNIDTRWLSFVLSSGRVRKLISDAATGTSSSMKNISKPNLLAIDIAIPDIGEQKNIAAIIHGIDKKIELSWERHKQNQILKKALMQDLLTGKVRVNVD